MKRAAEQVGGAVELVDGEGDDVIMDSRLLLLKLRQLLGRCLRVDLLHLRLRRHRRVCHR